MVPQMSKKKRTQQTQAQSSQSEHQPVPLDDALRRLVNTPPKPKRKPAPRKKHGRDDVATKPDKE